MLPQLRLRPLSKLLLKPFILRMSRPRILLRNRSIIAPTLRVLARRAPQLGLRPLLYTTRSHHLDKFDRVREPRVRLDELLLQPSVNTARVHGGAFDIRVALRKIFGEEDVGEFGLAVARPGAVVGHWPFDVGEYKAAFGTPHVAGGAQVDDADIGVGLFGSFAQCGEESGGQEGVADVVGAELDLVAFFCGAWGHGHNAGVVHEDVEAG